MGLLRDRRTDGRTDGRRDLKTDNEREGAVSRSALSGRRNERTVLSTSSPSSESSELVSRIEEGETDKP